MKIYFIAFLVTVFSTQILADKEDEESSKNFKYSHLKLGLIQTDDTAIGLSASLPLPGGLYIVLQRKAEGVDTSDDSYDRIINAARLGIHAGIGDIFESKYKSKLLLMVNLVLSKFLIKKSLNKGIFFSIKVNPPAIL